MGNSSLALIIAILTAGRPFPSEAPRFSELPAREIPIQVSADIKQAPSQSDLPKPERGAAALDQAEKDLRCPFVVACIAARPGEEDSSALVYCRKKLGAQAVAAFVSRGEFSEYESPSPPRESIGVIRTCQALEVAGAEGADLYFLNLPDQPYEQSADETVAALEKKDGLLSMVRFIRTIHPDVIIGGGEQGPGNTAELAIERLAVRAADSAADPGQFPEAGSPWSVKRLYWRATQGDPDATVDVGEFDALRGESYAHIAEVARRAYPPHLQHQIPNTVYYKLQRPVPNSSTGAGGSILKGLTVAKTIEDEISVPPSIAAGDLHWADRRQLAQDLSGRLYVMRSSGSDEELRERFGVDYFRVARFMRCLEKAIGLALGLDFEMQLSDAAVIPGQKFGVRLKITNGTDSELPVEFQTPAAFPTPGVVSTLKTDLTNAEAGHSIAKDYDYQVPEAAPLTVPHELHLYDSSFFPVGDGRWPRGRPFGLAFGAAARVNVGAVNISVQAITTIDVLPPFEFSVTPQVALLKDFETVRALDFTARIVNHTPGTFAGELWVVPLAVAKDDYEPIQVRFAREDEEVEVPLKLQAPIQKPPLATSILLEFRRPRPAPPAALVSFKIDIRPVGLAVAESLQIGYISGTGSSVYRALGEALDELGCRHESITMQNLRFADGSTDLKRFDSIIVDSNAYHDLPELVRLNHKLLEYVRAGGNLVVMSQRAAEWNSIPGLAPFPMTLSKQATRLQMNMARIVDDGAAVLNQPNKIEASDLTNWPIERAAYLPEAWDSQYQRLIDYGSLDSTPAPSLLLFARAGAGTYLYTAIGVDEAIARMNPGSYRLISNLLSLPKYNTRARSAGNVVK